MSSVVGERAKLPSGQPEGCDQSAQEQEKSKNQLKNEAKRAEKLKKLQEKQAKHGDMAEKAKPKAKAALQATGGGELDPDTTVPGEKKDMSRPMAPSYSPRHVESAWYAWWERSGFFTPEYAAREGAAKDAQERFVMLLPPPNVTGSLHVGHAMMGAVEDALARWHRMCGKEVLYLPGCDHAGIATQAVVEKKLKKERNVTRHDLGREAFLKEIWAYKAQYGDRIYQQLRRLGASVDWTRACFTLDPQANAAVNEAFVRMFDDGLIVRANRLVNWSGKLQTALSDLEVDMVEIEPHSWHAVVGHRKEKYEFGTMTSFVYRLEDGSGEIVIMTTRPETVFADTAVAVHPSDERYRLFHGKRVIHPITGKSLPVIVDEVADPAFGTGALKISPAHDHTDFVVGQRHGLDFVVVLDEHNRMNEQAPGYEGMARYDAREAVIEAAKRNGTFRGQTAHAMSLPVCSRSGDFVEPRMMPQWWCRCNNMATQALAAERDGHLSIAPAEYRKVWENWLGNIRDWCLSRQLWWGHRIPAYQVFPSPPPSPSNSSSQQASEETWVVGRTEEEALQRAKAQFPEAVEIRLAQDPDVLDTWFSSGLWPLSTLGWPEKTPDLDRFFPSTLLETGGDILFFWVARMVMMSMYLTGKVPFSQVFLHAIIRDAHGRKMSKSLGNVIDPIDVIQGISLAELHATLERGNLDRAEVERAKEGQRRDFPNGIPECGTDALRFALCSYVAHGRDVNLSIAKVESFRKFCNKLWNACRFAQMKLGDDFGPSEVFALSGSETPADKWILSRLDRAIKDTSDGFVSYSLMHATAAVHSFWLYDLCDVYIEAIKPVLPDASACGPVADAARQVLYYCMEQGLRLLHPFMPYVTEELYQRLPRRPRDKYPSISVSPFPISGQAFLKAAIESSEVLDFARIYAVVKSIRSMAAEGKTPKGSPICLHSSNTDDQQLFASHEAQMAALVKAVGTLSLSTRPLSTFIPDQEGISLSFAFPSSFSSS